MFSTICILPTDTKFPFIILYYKALHQYLQTKNADSFESAFLAGAVGFFLLARRSSVRAALRPHCGLIHSRPIRIPLPLEWETKNDQLKPIVLCLAGAVGFEPTTKVLETHVWRACRPPGTEFHITPPNWSFKSDFQSLMNIIAEFLHLTRGHNKGPKDPRGKSCLFGMPSRKQKESPSTHKSESMGFAILILSFYNFSTQKNVICQPMHDPLESGTSTSLQ